MPLYRIVYTRTTQGVCFLSADNAIDAAFTMVCDDPEIRVNDVTEVTLPDDNVVRLDKDYNLITT